MATRPLATARKTQPRKARSTKYAGVDPLYAINSFAGLPFDIKYHFLHELHFSPSELLCLSQINRSWRECATEDALWAPWFEVLHAPWLSTRRLHREAT